MMLKIVPRLFLPLLLSAGVFLAGCQGLTSGLKSSEETPGQPIFAGPTKFKVLVGEFIPGTGVQYIGPVEDKGAEVRIDGAVDYKQSADSLKWKGSPVANAEVLLNQRLAWYNDKNMATAGTISVRVKNARPQALPAKPEAPVEYSMPYADDIVIGERLPGSTLTLVGIDPDLGAQFTGWAEDRYGYKSVADSVKWFGALAPGIAVTYDLKVAWIEEDTVNLAGVVTVYLTPQ